MKEISLFIISVTDIVFTDDFLASDFVYKHTHVCVHTHDTFSLSLVLWFLFLYLSSRWNLFWYKE